MNTELNTIYIGYSNQKGGCGKSTLTQLNAKALAISKGLKVCVIECDAQGSLVNSIEALKDKEPDFKPPYDLIVCQVNEVGDVSKNTYGKYDYVFIDMPGTLDQKGIMSMLAVSDILIIPVTASQYDLDASLNFLEIAKKVKNIKNEKNIPFEIYSLINKDKRIKEYTELKEILNSLKVPQFNSTIKDKVAYNRHQSNFTDPLKDSDIRYEYGIFIDELMEKSEALLNSITNTLNA
jgi:cellulose biosynthesis protein BcsQ